MNSAYSKEDLKKEVIILLRNALMIQEHVVRITYNPKDRKDEYIAKRYIWESLQRLENKDDDVLLKQCHADYSWFIRNNHDLP